MDGLHEKSPITQREVNLASQIKLSRKVLPLDENDKPDNHTLLILSMLKTPEERERHLRDAERAREIGNNQRRFWNMLVSTVERSGYKPPQGRQTIILNLCCGMCEEGKVLSAFFGGEEFGCISENVKLIGIDIKQEAIKRAIRNCSILDFSGEKIEYVLPANFEFIVGDATNLDQFPQIPKEVDVVVIRHQQISHNEAVWTNIFKQALERVSKDGIVIITSLLDFEHEMLIKALQKLDCEIVINKKNPWAAQLGDEKIFSDRKIAIIRKKNLPPSSAEPSNPAKTE